MAGSLNRAMLIGRLGKDPEVRRMQSGDPIVNLSVATSETWKDKSSGEKKEATEWHRVVIFNKNLAEVAEKYLKKGALVHIEGQIKTRKWTDKDGTERYSTEIVLQNFNGTLNMLGGGGQGGDDRGGDRGNSQQSSQKSGNSKATQEFDDEIPF